MCEFFYASFMIISESGNAIHQAYVLLLIKFQTKENLDITSRLSLPPHDSMKNSPEFHQFIEFFIRIIFICFLR